MQGLLNQEEHILLVHQQRQVRNERNKRNIGLTMKQTFLNILKWFEQLSTFVKVIGVVIPLLAGAVKLVTAHDNKVRAEYEQQKTEQQDQTELKANVKTIITQNNKTDSLFKVLQKNQEEIKTDMTTIRTDITTVATAVKNLSADVVDLYAKNPTVTKADIVQIMQGLQFEISQPKVVNKSMDKSVEPYKFNVKIIPLKK